MVEALGDLPIRSAVLDGELVLLNADGTANFYELMAEMRTRRPDESRFRYYVFDLVHADGVDLRHLPYSERRRDLERLCRKSRVHCMSMIEAFPCGDALFDHCVRLNFEGIVAKRVDKPYTSGPAKWWLKVKNPEWARVNARRYLMFETKPKLTERDRALVRKREELVEVRERLQNVALSQDGARELRKHQALLEQQIAELERLS